MINWGTVPAGSVLPFMFASYDGATGASEAISGLAVTDIEVYKGTSVTQRASDAGYALIDTDGIDIDSLVGINGFSIDTGDNTDAGFYTVGSFFTVVVASITADGQTVNFIAGTFRLAPAETSAGVQKVDVTHYGGSAGTFSSGRPEVNTSHIAGGSTAATNLRRSAEGIVLGAAATGTLSSTQMTTNLTEATDDHYNDRAIVWTSGVLAGQASQIMDYDGATKMITYLVTPSAEAPSNGDTFVIL